MPVEADAPTITSVCSVAGVCPMGHNIRSIGLCEVGYADGFEEPYSATADNGCLEASVLEPWDASCRTCRGVRTNIRLVHCYTGGYGHGLTHLGLTGVATLLSSGGHKDPKDPFHVRLPRIVRDSARLACTLSLKSTPCYCWATVEKGTIVKVE